MASTSSFVPKGQQELLLRTPLTFGFAPTNYEPTSSLPVKELQPPRDGGTSKERSFHERNKPHPGRVQHIKGILGSPICSVEDNTDRRPLTPPSGRDFGPPYRPVGGTRYGSNWTKGLPAVGVVPVTNAWRDELEKKTHMAISRAMGQPPPSRGGVMSRSGLRMQQQEGGQFHHLRDDQLLELLCKILQTDSIPKCQAWLASTSDTEKNIVLNMIRMAATGETNANPSSTRPRTHELQYRFVWAPEKSHTRKARGLRPNPSSYHSDDETEFDFSYSARHREQYPTEANKEPSDTTFKLLEHGNVIRTARQVSNFASHQSSRIQKTRSLDLSEVKTEDFTSGGGHQIQASSKAQRLPSSHDQFRQHRSRSNSFSGMGPKPTGALSRRRMRSSSARATMPRLNYPENPTVPPVKVSVTKEKIQPDSGSGKARLRYTSHWET